MKGNVEQRGKISWRLTAYLGYDPNTGAQKRERKTVKAENSKGGKQTPGGKAAAGMDRRDRKGREATWE